MKKLQRLLKYGTDEEIIAYVRSDDFRAELDIYNMLNTELTNAKKACLELAKQANQRHTELTEYKATVDKMAKELKFMLMQK